MARGEGENVEYIKKRRPPQDSEKKRMEIAEQLKTLTPLQPIDSNIIGISTGNAKTGASGKHFDSVFVWNLPPFVTCPGCSEWCFSHCYNADERSEVYPIQRWRENWWTFLNAPQQLEARINTQLSEAPGRVAVRIHSSGDFFSTEYIHFWLRIISNHPEVKFWAYTRSWAVEELKRGMQLLYGLPNMSLFASYDTTMCDYKLHLPKSYVFDTTEDLLSFEKNMAE